ncbi:MAG: response regulator transcription factor [Wenzhouxiangellaceae bacterium]
MSRQNIIHVGIVHRERIWRESLSRLLEPHRDMRVVGSTHPDDSGHLSTRVQEMNPDVVLLDLDWPERSGLVRVRQMLCSCSDLRILVTGIPNRDSEVISVIEAGASGYLTLDSGLKDVVANIRALAAGDALCSRRITRLLFRRVANTAHVQERAPDAGSGDIHLTRRELQVMVLIEEGLSNKDIARHLSIELQTVKNHVHNILVKLSLRRRTEVAHYVRLNGLSDRKSTGTFRPAP